MNGEIAACFLGGLGLLFGGYGVWELTRAYKATALITWRERALPGGGGIIVAALFAAMARQVFG